MAKTPIWESRFRLAKLNLDQEIRWLEAQITNRFLDVGELKSTTRKDAELKFRLEVYKCCRKQLLEIEQMSEFYF